MSIAAKVYLGIFAGLLYSAIVLGYHYGSRPAKVVLPLPPPLEERVTPQQRIDATWECLARFRRGLNCD